MIRADVKMADYVADRLDEGFQIQGLCPPSLNSSVAHALLTRSPKHAWTKHPRLNPAWAPDDDRGFDMGTAAHGVLLEGRTLDVVPFDNYRKKSAQELRDAIIERGGIPALEPQARAVEQMVAVARAKLFGSPDLAGYREFLAEQTILWEQDGAWLRCRPDWMTLDHAVIVSFKTTTNAEPDAFLRHALMMGYDVQSAFELAGVKAATGVDARYVWLASECEPPYAASLVGLSPALLNMAQSKLSVAVDLWRDCLTRDHWPAYPDRICYMDPPAWALGNWNERMTLSGANLPDDVEAL